LTGPAGLKSLPYGAVERLLACKLGGILTYFQRKVNTKFSLLRPPAALRRLPFSAVPHHLQNPFAFSLFNFLLFQNCYL
jgi:hypothetical protein